MKKIRKAIIPAAGLGTRMLPISYAVPKEMLPIVDLPAVYHLVKEAADSGIEDILIITNRGKEAMESFFDRSTEYEAALSAKGKTEELVKGDFFNPYFQMLRAGYGTLAYQDAWNLFDNICVTENLVNAEDGKLRIIKGDKFYGNIFTRPYMIQQEGQYKGYPLRTFVTNNFQNGFSDHLPVYIYIGK
jgi:UTP-glucose-1-phosphate uridylyltransferase